MLKRHKDLLRTLMNDLRRTLLGAPDTAGNWQRGDLDRELERLGIAPDGTLTPLDALPNPTTTERRAWRVAEAQLAQLPAKDRAAARTELVERAAYSWINRLLALRAMEARGLIEETLRPNPDYEGLSEALYVLRQTDPARAGGADAGWWAVIEDACAQDAAPPGLFDLTDPAVALRPSTPTLLRVVRAVGGVLSGFTLAEADAAWANPDAIGWAYQFYQEAAKARVYAKLSSGGKVSTRAEIAAATQLFTEPYMVQWLLQNSLGRSYHEAYPTSTLPATWPYYIRPENQAPAAHPLPLAGLTVLDPCMGSGHFLREAFDMLGAMYREQYPAWNATQVADVVLRDHLFGIDIDPRAAQLAVLTLYLRAWEGVRDERRASRQPGPGTYRPPAMNLATTPSGLTPGALERHLVRHPGDRLFRPLLEGIFAALEQADLLGSLIHPGEHLDRAIATLTRSHTIPMDFDPDEAALRRTITELAGRDPAELKRTLLDRIATSFAAEAGEADVAAALFGREATQGVRLLQLLDRRYAVVVTNPPYMGSRSMNLPLKSYVEQNYPFGKRDLATAMLLRACQLTYSKGRVAMILQQSWMFLGSFAELRAVTPDKLPEAIEKGNFRGLLRETSVEAVAHLGRHAFSEADPPVPPAMFILRNAVPTDEHRLWACRLRTPRVSEEQAELLQKASKLGTKVEYVFIVQQVPLLNIPGSPVVYWVNEDLLATLVNNPLYGKSWAHIKAGVSSASAERYLRYVWESPNHERWYPLAKGGGHKRWFGLTQYTIDWENTGSRIKLFEGSVVRNEEFQLQPGITYSLMARGSVSCRIMEAGSIFDFSGSGIFPKLDTHLYGLFFLQSRYASFMLRLVTRSMIAPGYVDRLPVPSMEIPTSISNTAQFCVALKKLSTSSDVVESHFRAIVPTSRIDVHLAAIEGFFEHICLEAFKLASNAIDQIIDETGTPAGWFPFIAGYDVLPELPTDLDLPSLPPEVLAFLEAHERLHPDTLELARIKSNLRLLYEAGPGAKDVAQEEAAASEGDEEEAVSGAHIPIPTETFLEALSVRLQLHPITVYRLLEEGRAAGWRCKPEEQRLLEDRLSVLVLRLLGHRWPHQIEAGEPVPAWADADGIIPLLSGMGEPSLAERLRTRLREDDGPLGAQRAEGLLQELTGLGLEEWLRRTFFTRHVRQFKYRPIAWHLASTPSAGGGKRKGGRRAPAFECLLYYHACERDVLARIRTQYIEPLLRVERGRVADSRQAGDDTTAAQATERIHELEDFAARLRTVEDDGFACPELDPLLANEPPDRWSGDGYSAPPSHDALVQQERAWRVDLNDGVRVNIAPLQLAGLLAGDVFKAAEARKAIADRARWRADERRWVRAGKLPRPGWFDPSVPESPAWHDLAPQRALEQQKLAAKRQAAERNVAID